jgi:branched-chain amino acid aminotransferase
MLRIRWTEATGWEAPSIEPCGSYRFRHNFYQYVCFYVLVATINLSPGATVLHYAQALFEGMKAYRHEDGTVTMFRPDMNMKRMNISAQRLALPVRSTLLF